MAKIIKIELTNYRSYFNRYEIDIPDAKNLLIYGENGSGKSSLYEALKQFYIASDATQRPKLSRHLSVPEKYETPEGQTVQSEVSVKVTYREANGNLIDRTFGVPNGNVEGNQTIRSFSQQSVFLSYRELLRTHLMSNLYDKFEFQTKFADLIITQILSHKRNAGTNQTYQKNWVDLYVKGKGSRPNRGEKETLLANFDLGFKQDIAEINQHLNAILKYFEPNLTIELKVEDSYIEYDGQNYPVFQISLKGKFFEMNLTDNDETHLSVLNEARLSALAISIFLAGIITTNQQKIPQKFLFLDDIFIGLDMSNRKPLLQILTEYKIPTYEEEVDAVSGKLKYTLKKDGNGNVISEATPFFNRYQIFITTYDKHWFEIAKNYLQDSYWQSVEMYSHFDEDNKIELPLILTPSLDYYERATLYFKKNKEDKDYPAAANYLRKECEQQLKRILYGNYALKNGEKGTTVLREELDDLRQGFEKQLTDLGFSYASFTDFTNIAKSTLHPLSHDNLQKPIYKRELVEAFKLIDDLRAITKKTAFEKDGMLTVTTINAGVQRITTLKIVSEVLFYQFGTVKRLTPILLKPVKYVEGNSTINLKLAECTVEKAYDMIHHSVFKTNNASNGVDVFPSFILQDGSNLKTAIANSLI